LQLAALIDVVIGPEDAARPKPAPEMLLLALARLGVDADAALYVGDMVVDVQTARGAGVAVWVVPTGSDSLEVLQEAHPDRLLPDLGELAAWLRRQQK
jgi:phosphoglycolate phosphatase